jgi:hypothetical protein
MIEEIERSGCHLIQETAFPLPFEQLGGGGIPASEITEPIGLVGRQEFMFAIFEGRAIGVVVREVSQSDLGADKLGTSRVVGLVEQVGECQAG